MLLLLLFLKQNFGSIDICVIDGSAVVVFGWDSKDVAQKRQQ